MRVARMVVTSILALNLAASVAFGNDSPVAVVGDLDPKFSIQVNPSELRQISQGLEDLGHLPELSLNINELFEPGDEAPIQEALQAIQDRIFNAVRKLIEMRAMVYKASALDAVVSNEDLSEQIRTSHTSKFSELYTKMIIELAKVDDASLNALYECRSELCVATILGAQQEMIAFAKAINRGRVFRYDAAKNGIFRGSFGALNQSLKKASTSDPNFVKAASQIAAGLSGVSSGSLDASDLQEKVLGRDRRLSQLGFSTTRLPRAFFRAESDWLTEAGRIKIQGLIEKSTYNIPPPRVRYRRTHLLKCNENPEIQLGEFYAVLFGKNRRAVSCKTTREDP